MKSKASFKKDLECMVDEDGTPSVSWCNVQERKPFDAGQSRIIFKEGQ